MPDRNHPGYREYLASVGRPVVTDEERVEVRQLHAQGFSLTTIAKKLGRAKSTIFCIVHERVRR